MIVDVLQYMKPDGRRVPMTTEISDSFEAPYNVIKGRGWRLAAEVLTTEEISITVEDEEQDFACEVVPNGPEVPRAIERAIAKAVCTPPEGYSKDDEDDDGSIGILSFDDLYDAGEHET